MTQHDLAGSDWVGRIESSGALRFGVALDPAGGASIRIENRTGDPRSPLLHALRRHLLILADERRLAWPHAGDLLALPPATRWLAIRLHDDRDVLLLRAAIDGAALSVEHHYELSPLEARYLGDNGVPHPITARSTPLPLTSTDLHTHFAGCVSGPDLVAIGLEHDLRYPRRDLELLGIDFPGADAEVRLRDLPRAATARLERALVAPVDHQITHSDMQRIYALRRPITKAREAFWPLVVRIARDYAAMGVRWVELSLYDIAESWRLEVLHERLPELEAETGVSMRFLGAMSRHDDVEWDLDYIERLGDLARSRYLAGVDFMGRESNSTYDFARQLEAVCAWAHDHRPGFVVRVHAGENPAHPENIRAAIELTRGFDVQLRIGHGLYGVDDATLAEIVARGVIIEFNLQSNLALNNLQATTEAMLERYLDAGAAVVLGTDGYGIYGTSAALEMRAASLTGVDVTRLGAIVRSEQDYIAHRHAHEAAATDPPGHFVVPPARPRRHYSDAVADRKRAQAAARRAKMAARLEQCGIHLLDGAAAIDRLADRPVLAISGAWRKSWQRFDDAAQARATDFLRATLHALAPTHTILAGATTVGVEGMIHRIARKSHIPMVGAFVDALPPDALDEGIDTAIRVGSTLYDKAAGLYALLQQIDASVLFVGGGQIVSDEIQIARNLRVPHWLLGNVPGASAQHAREQPHRRVDSAADLVAALRRPKWHSVEGRYHHQGANPSVDVAVLRELGPERQVLLIRRRDTAGSEPGKWALPGGFQHTDAPRGKPWTPGFESPRAACVREVFEETGLAIAPLESRLVHIADFEGSGRDPRDSRVAWSRAQLFKLALPTGYADQVVLIGGDDASDARWFSIDALPTPLAFDHEAMLGAVLTAGE